MSESAYSIFCDAEIAINNKKYDLAKELLKKGKERSIEEMAESEKKNFSHYIPGSGLSQMMCWGSDLLANRNSLEFAEGLEKRLEKEMNGGIK